MFGPTKGQGRWSTDRIYERMKANHGTMTKLLFPKPDDMPDDNLEESLNILRGDSTDNSKKDKSAKDALVVPWILHDLRQFFKDHHKFLIHACLNNEIKDDILLKHGPRVGNQLVGSLNYSLATEVFWDLEVIPVSSADFLDLGSSFDDEGGTEASLIEEGGESSIVPTGSSKAQAQTRVEKRKRRKAKHKASDSGHTEEVAGVQDENPGHQAESTIPEIAGPEVENGPTLVADETPAVVSTLDSVVAEDSALKFPEFINAPEDSATSDVAVPAEAAPNVAAVNSAPTGDSGSVSNDRARVIAQLRAQSPPPSIAEARARRASIKQERRDSIEFIRSRTTSRASAGGRPSGLSFSAVPSAAPRMPRALEHTAGPHSGDVVDDELVVGPVSLARPESTGAAEPVKAPKRGKWVAPLPEDQDWRVVSPAPRIPVGSAAPTAHKKKSKSRRAANPGAQSHNSSALPAEIGLASTSEVGTTIAEDFASGPGPVASRDDESAGHGNTKPPPSITSRKSLHSELEMTSKSIVEDSASEQSRGDEHAQGRLTKAALTTTRNTLITVLIEAGVSPSALSSFGDESSHLKAYEATGRQSPVAVRALEVQTVLLDGVTFETPRRGCGHRRSQSMPEHIGDASSETSESGDDSDLEVLAGSSNPALVGNLGPVMANTIASDPVRLDSVVSSMQSSPKTPPRQFSGVSLVLGSPLVAAPVVASPSAAPVVACSVVLAPESEPEMAGSHLFKDPAQAFTTSVPEDIFWNGKNMSSAEVVSVLGARLPRPLTIEDHPLVNVFLRASHPIGCAFCGLATTESFEEGPEWKQSQVCPGCGPASEVRYCDVGCLLADVLEHAKVCGSQSPSCPIFWVRMPQRYQKMLPPLRQVTGSSVSPECHRQMIYSMLVHDAPARNPYWKWAEVSLTPEERDEMGRFAVFRAEEMVEPGDYFLFEPTPAPDFLPDLIPMAYMVIRFTDSERTAFNRVLNVAFHNRVPAAVNFIHRMLFDFLVHASSDRISLRRNRIRLFGQLQQEFPEFGVFAEPDGKFEFGSEWKEIELLVQHFECRLPLLRAWCRDDPARQQNGERQSSIWSRFVGEEWDGVMDPNFVVGHPVPRGIFPAGYHGVEPCVYEPELQGMYRQRVEAALREVEE